MNNNKKISIKDIANIAGISVSTVSRILNQTGRYSRETEQKVLAIVEEYGYTANMSAKSLRNSRTKTISLMIPDITNEFFARIAYYCETFLHDKGYTLFICNTKENPEIESQYINDFISKNVDGLIAISHLTNTPKCLENYRFPIVTLDRKAQYDPSIPYVINNDYQASYDATELLIKRGCRHIIGLIPGKDAGMGSSRFDGFRDAMNFYHLRGEKEEDSYRIDVSDRSRDESEELVLRLLENGKQIDGIFCGSDRIALGACHAAKRFGLKIPEDIKIIGFDNSVYSRLAEPPISTLKRNSQELSVTACEMLLKLIEEPHQTLESRVIPTTIIERCSTMSVV